MPDAPAPDAPWWTIRFEELSALHPSFNDPVDDRAEAEVEFILRLANNPSAARVLDVGCGGGRHAILLAEQGHAVVGIDLSPRILRVARERWEERNPADAKSPLSTPVWMPGDMRWLPAGGPYDLALLMDCTLGMFDDDAEHLRALASVAEQIRPGGHVVAVTMNPYHWSGRARAIHIPPGAIADDIDVVRSYRFDAARGRNEERLVVFKDGERFEPPAQSLRAWTPPELVSLFRAAGFHQVRVHGSEGWSVPEERMPVHPTESVWLWTVATR